LVSVAPRHKRLLDLLGLLRVLPVFASQEEAITACWSAKTRGCSRAPRPEWLAWRSPVGGALTVPASAREEQDDTDTSDDEVLRATSWAPAPDSRESVERRLFSDDRSSGSTSAC
jgi:hypothetical protein